MFNKNSILKTAICATALLASGYSATSSAVGLTGEATAVVVFPLALVKNTDMDFGTISVGAAGTVIITEGSTVGTGTLLTTAVTPANFTVTAEAATAYTVAYTTGTMSDGTDTIDVLAGTFTDNASLLGSGVAEIFEVGAQITLTGAEGSGSYTTLDPGFGVPFGITVNY